MGKLTELIAEVYTPFNMSVKYGQNLHHIIYGGRGSCKSSAISIMIMKEMWAKRNRHKHALILRKYANTLQISVVNQMLWAAKKLGLENFITFQKNPLKITFKGTEQTILFAGLDDPLKLKSLKTQFGHIGYTWIEEAIECKDSEIRSVFQTVLRGGDSFATFMSFNPPKSKNHWLAQEVLNPQSQTYVQKTTCFDVPRHWLAETFFSECERLKQRNEIAYRNEILGEMCGEGTEIFNNLEIRKINDDDLNNITLLRGGIDFGFAIDPQSIVVVGFCKNRNTLYVIDQVHGLKMTNEECFSHCRSLKEKWDLPPQFTWYCDCAEPKSIDFLRSKGLSVLPCTKGRDSRAFGYKWLQSLDKIVIDPRCSLASSEMSAYEYRRDRYGEVISGEYPDGNDNSADSIRYACDGIMNRRSSIFSED